MLGGERQQLVGILQQEFGVRTNAPAYQRSVPQRDHQVVRTRKPARLPQRRVTPGQCLIEISERDQKVR
jgi:hypothetical protein